VAIHFAANGQSKLTQVLCLRQEWSLIMINSKQRAYLRGMANGIETIGQIGKSGINENLIKQIEEALTARELIKLRVLETSPASAREAAQQLADCTATDIVQVIGARIVLFKQNEKKPVINIKKI
jgi:RNA-binding protein